MCIKFSKGITRRISRRLSLFIFCFSVLLQFYSLARVCFLFLFFFLLFNYSCPHFLHFFPLPYPPPTSHIQSSLPLSLCIGPLYMFLDLTLPLLYPVIPLSPPLWQLLVCPLFHCLWFYFACLLVLLIRFHL